MTAPNFTELDNDSLGANKIARRATAQALYDNPVAIAQRGTDAPIVQVPVIEVKTSGTGATWTWPDGVTAATFWIQAGGGEGGSGITSGNDGGNSSITYNSITTTAIGGKGGQVTGGGIALPTQGGDGGGGNFAVAGESSASFQGSGSFFGVGGTLVGGGTTSPTKGGGGYGDVIGGAGGEMVRIRLVKVSGLNTVTYTVGAGGAGASSAQNGADGCIVIEY